MVLATQPELPPDLVRTLDETEAARLRALRRAGWRRSHAELPVQRAAGPLVAMAYGMGLSHQCLLRSGHRVWADAVDADAEGAVSQGSSHDASDADAVGN